MLKGETIPSETDTEMQLGLKALMEMHILGKGMYRLGYNMNNRSDWIKIPLEGVLQETPEGDDE